MPDKECLASNATNGWEQKAFLKPIHRYHLPDAHAASRPPLEPSLRHFLPRLLSCLASSMSTRPPLAEVADMGPICLPSFSLPVSSSSALNRWTFTETEAGSVPHNHYFKIKHAVTNTAASCWRRDNKDNPLALKLPVNKTIWAPPRT